MRPAAGGYSPESIKPGDAESPFEPGLSGRPRQDGSARSARMADGWAPAGARRHAGRAAPPATSMASPGLRTSPGQRYQELAKRVTVKRKQPRGRRDEHDRRPQSPEWGGTAGAGIVAHRSATAR